MSITAQNVPRFKILVFGDPNVGKTSFIRCQRNGTFIDVYTPTKNIEVSTLPFFTNHGTMCLEVWDCPGDSDEISDDFYANSFAAIMMFDLTSIDSYNHIHKWYTMLINYFYRQKGTLDCPIPIIICGNKLDHNGKIDKLIKNPLIKHDILALCHISTKNKFNYQEPWLNILRHIIGQNNVHCTQEQSNANKYYWNQSTFESLYQKGLLKEEVVSKNVTNTSSLAEKKIISISQLNEDKVFDYDVSPSMITRNVSFGYTRPSPNSFSNIRNSSRYSEPSLGFISPRYRQIEQEPKLSMYMRSLSVDNSPRCTYKPATTTKVQSTPSKMRKITDMLFDETPTSQQTIHESDTVFLDSIDSINSNSSFQDKKYKHYSSVKFKSKMINISEKIEAIKTSLEKNTVLDTMILDVIDHLQELRKFLVTSI
jgi:small GTP-binding protein